MSTCIHFVQYLARPIASHTVLKMKTIMTYLYICLLVSIAFAGDTKTVKSEVETKEKTSGSADVSAKAAVKGAADATEALSKAGEGALAKGKEAMEGAAKQGSAMAQGAIGTFSKMGESIPGKFAKVGEETGQVVKHVEGAVLEGAHALVSLFTGGML